MSSIRKDEKLTQCFSVGHIVVLFYMYIEVSVLQHFHQRVT